MHITEVTKTFKLFEFEVSLEVHYTRFGLVLRAVIYEITAIFLYFLRIFIFS